MQLHSVQNKKFSNNPHITLNTPNYNLGRTYDTTYDQQPKQHIQWIQNQYDSQESVNYVQAQLSNSEIPYIRRTKIFDKARSFKDIKNNNFENNQYQKSPAFIINQNYLRTDTNNSIEKMYEQSKKIQQNKANKCLQQKIDHIEKQIKIIREKIDYRFMSEQQWKRHIQMLINGKVILASKQQKNLQNNLNNLIKLKKSEFNNAQLKKSKLQTERNQRLLKITQENQKLYQKIIEPQKNIVFQRPQHQMSTIVRKVPQHRLSMSPQQKSPAKIQSTPYGNIQSQPSANIQSPLLINFRLF